MALRLAILLAIKECSEVLRWKPSCMPLRTGGVASVVLGALKRLEKLLKVPVHVLFRLSKDVGALGDRRENLARIGTLRSRAPLPIEEGALCVSCRLKLRLARSVVGRLLLRELCIGTWALPCPSRNLSLRVTASILDLPQPPLYVPAFVILLGSAASMSHKSALPGKRLIKGTTIPLKNKSFLLGLERAIHESRRGETFNRPVKTRWLFRVRPSTQTKLEPLKTPLTLWEVRRLPIPRAKFDGTLFYPWKCP